MVRIINIDTKNKTIRVSNGKDDLEWFTTDTGSHVPLKKGQSKAEAIKEHFGDKKSNPQLERLEKMGKAWGKDQMSVLRELGKKNPQGLKDELDRIDTERERITKAHKEWLKGKDAPRPAKQDKDIEDVGGWPKNPKFEKLTKQYMPKQGEADTELGEILRSINRVVYRYYNDGDMWNRGYGKETVNGAIKHLTELSKNKETPRRIARGLDNALFELKKYGVKYKDRYETALKMMLQTMEWADEKEIEALSKMKRNTEKQL